MEGTPHKTAIRRRKRTKAGRYVDELTREELAAHFGLPAQQAAAAVGVSFTIFKRICRNFGLERWPYRRLKALGLAADPPAAAPMPSQPARHAGAPLPTPALPQQHPGLLLACGTAGYPGAAAALAAQAMAEAAERAGAAGAAAAAVPAPALVPSAGMPDMHTLASSDMRASGLSCGTSATDLGGALALPVAQAPSAALGDDPARCPSVRSGLCCLAEVATDVGSDAPAAAAAAAASAPSSRQQQEQQESRSPSPWQVELALQAQRAKQSHDAISERQQRQQRQQRHEPHSIRVLLCAATAAAHAGREPELQTLLRMLLSEIDRRLVQPEDELQRDALLRLKQAVQERLGRSAGPATGGAAAAAAAGAAAQSPRQSAAQQPPLKKAKPAKSEEEGFGFELSLALPVPLMQQQAQQSQQQAQRPPQQAELQLEFPQPQHEPPQLEFPRLPRLRLPFAAALMQAAVHFPQLQAAAAAAAAAVSEPAALTHVQPWPSAHQLPALQQPRADTPAESHGSVMPRFGPAAAEDLSPHTADSATGNAAFGAFAPAPAALPQRRAVPVRPRPVPPQAFSALAELVAAAHPEGQCLPDRLATARVEVQRLRAASASPSPSAFAP
ncbi:hypothetical protein ABPG75_003865 [Micractinium tetrahymenae]